MVLPPDHEPAWPPPGQRAALGAAKPRLLLRHSRGPILTRGSAPTSFRKQSTHSASPCRTSCWRTRVTAAVPLRSMSGPLTLHCEMTAEPAPGRVAAQNTISFSAAAVLVSPLEIGRAHV